MRGAFQSSWPSAQWSFLHWMPSDLGELPQLFADVGKIGNPFRTQYSMVFQDTPHFRGRTHLGHDMLTDPAWVLKVTPGSLELPCVWERLLPIHRILLV